MLRKRSNWRDSGFDVAGKYAMSASTTIEWVGTGSALNFSLGNTSFLVYSEGPSTLLVDCGSTVPARLAELGKLDAVTDIILTHAHADHIGGVEAFGFYSYFVRQNQGDSRPRLHLATEALANHIWDHSLSGGMGIVQDADGVLVRTTLETYFNVEIGHRVEVPGLPGVTLFSTPHVQGMENYGLWFDNGVYYSGDTVALPPEEPKLIFHDCQFYEEGRGDVHVSYHRLARELPCSVKSKTHLVHLSNEHKYITPHADGFAGFVSPGQKFVL